MLECPTLAYFYAVRLIPISSLLAASWRDHYPTVWSFDHYTIIPMIVNSSGQGPNFNQNNCLEDVCGYLVNNNVDCISEAQCSDFLLDCRIRSKSDFNAV